MPVSRCLAAAFACFGFALAGCAGPVAPDVVITNARVFTNDPARPWAEAVAMKGERVVAVGTASEVLGPKGPATKVIDAGGRVVVPGFNDARVDLPLEPPTPAGLAALDHAALTRGVTSLQVVAGGPMRSLVVAAQQATRQARWRLIRSPMDGERPHDEEPFLPPQPGVRLVASGVAWQIGPSVRLPVAGWHVPTAVEWAYRAEDPLVMAGDPAGWVDALSNVGLAQVWARKRPRLDMIEPVFIDDLRALSARGVVVGWMPFHGWIDSTPKGDRQHGPGWLGSAGLVVCLGSAGVPRPMAAIRLATDTGRGGTPLSREDAVRAMTWGSAYAEKAERDKGWLGRGTLADIAVLSDDVFTAPAERLAAITSVLTVVGGAIVYDAGVLASIGPR